ncbi:AraC family transcriptional regulator [Microbulbifer epialgicus]|uniref:AraC family transcriptional regulator ligand-binding domain-containing protein n=1 Tax=Microbulbifer epialgicus TaxID=393907 RepID=A0ABV4NXC2_9GAMM
MAENGHTTIATWVLPIIETLKPYCSPREVLQKASISACGIEDTNRRIPLENMKKLWDLAESLSRNDCIGLQVAKHVNHTNLHALSYAHLASSSIRESLERSSRFSEVVSTAMRISIRDEQHEVIVSLLKVEGLHYEPSIHAVDAFIALLIKSCRKISPDIHKHLIAINLTRTKPVNPEHHRMMYRCPVGFSANTCEIRLKRDFVDRRICSGNNELAHINEQALTNYLARLRKNDIISITNKILIDLMPTGDLSQEIVAKTIGISCRSLHRKLKEKGSSYQAILDKTRKHQAIHYLKQQELPVTSITYKLGFSDTSSFSRSFKKWTGKSPREFRKHGQQEEHSTSE